MGFLSTLYYLVKPVSLIIVAILVLIGFSKLVRYGLIAIWENYEEDLLAILGWVRKHLKIFQPWKFWTAMLVIALSFFSCIVLILLIQLTN